MSVELTQMVFAGIMAVAVFVWAWSVRLATRLGKRNSANTDVWSPAFSIESNDESETDVSGTQTVQGTPDSVTRRIAYQFLNTYVPGQFSSLFELVERSDRRLVMRKTGPLICNQPSGMYFSEVEFNIEPVCQNSVEVSYRIGFERLRSMLRRISLGLILGVGLPVLLIVPTVIWVFVVNNPHPAVRWQVFQTLQVVHVLWPPFLLTSFLGSGQRHARTFVSNLLRSVELADEISMTENV